MVRQLLHQRHDVVAFARPTSDVSELRRLGVPVVTGSLLDGEGLREGLTDVDAVAHLAGGGKVVSNDDFFRQNTVTTERLVDAIATHRPGLSRLVHVSSLSAHGPSFDGKPRDPTSLCAPASNYGHSKLLAERAVLHRHRQFPVTIMRPPAVYGPGDTRLLPLFRTIARFGVIPTLGHQRLSVVWGPDCARAIAKALIADTPSGRAYVVDDGNIYTALQLGYYIAGALNRRAWELPISPHLMSLVGWLNHQQARVRGTAVALTFDKVVDMRQPNWVCDSRRTHDELGWKPTTELVDGLAQTARWYRQRGWL